MLIQYWKTEEVILFYSYCLFFWAINIKHYVPHSVKKHCVKKTFSDWYQQGIFKDYLHKIHLEWTLCCIISPSIISKKLCIHLQKHVWYIHANAFVISQVGLLIVHHAYSSLQNIQHLAYIQHLCIFYILTNCLSKDITAAMKTFGTRIYIVKITFIIVGEVIGSHA